MRIFGKLLVDTATETVSCRYEYLRALSAALAVLGVRDRFSADLGAA